MMYSNKVIIVILVTLIALQSCNNYDEVETDFNPELDFISLHYDHAADRDDGHSTVADRMILQEQFGKEWIKNHTIAVSGAYGENKDIFVEESNTVMNAVWNDIDGWIAAHENRDQAINVMVEDWINAISNGGKVWIKEGGQSDLSADVIRRIQDEKPDLDTSENIIIVQHSDWNEDKTTDEDLEFVKQNSNYVRISDANEYLKDPEGNSKFANAAVKHPFYGDMWKVAFNYLNPEERVDFSDTGELFKILSMEKLTVSEFAEKYFPAYPVGE